MIGPWWDPSKPVVVDSLTLAAALQVQAADAAALAADWQRITGATVFPVGGIGNGLAASGVIYTPTATMELIRGFVATGDPADPLLAGAGAPTNLGVGVKLGGNLSITVIPNTSFLAWNASSHGAGTALTSSPAAAFFMLHAANALGPGTASRSLRIMTDVAASFASGTVRWALERHVVIP